MECGVWSVECGVWSLHVRCIVVVLEYDTYWRTGVVHCTKCIYTKYVDYSTKYEHTNRPYSPLKKLYIHVGDVCIIFIYVGIYMCTTR